MTNETLEAEYLYHLTQDKELFRLASLVGCEPQDEQRHREKLVEYVLEAITKGEKQ